MQDLPNPNTKTVSDWLRKLSRGRLHDEMWRDANRRFHGVTIAARLFAKRYDTDPDIQEALLDGVALALGAVGRFDDIRQLETMLQVPSNPATQELPAATTSGSDGGDV